MSGWLPPGVTDADIDRAAPGWGDPPFYCVNSKTHCCELGLQQCELCQWEEAEIYKHEQESSNDQPRHRDDRHGGGTDDAA